MVVGALTMVEIIVPLIRLVEARARQYLIYP